MSVQLCDRKSVQPLCQVAQPKMGIKGTHDRHTLLWWSNFVRVYDIGKALG